MPTHAFLDACRAFGLSPFAAQSVARTERAEVWRVPYKGGHAALKIPLPEAGEDEEPALRLYRYWDGDGAAQVLDAADGALLLEWLDGPTLGDRARAGDLAGADAALATLAGALQATVGPPPGHLPSLERWCRALLTLDLRQMAPDTLDWFESAARLAEDLLATAPPPKVLHADLHHDNVIVTDRGPLAFDPKGVFGDPAYEVANAFRNPLGIDAPLRDPARIEALAAAAADALDAPFPRIIGWAAVQAALSMAWRMTGHEPNPASAETAMDLDILAALGRCARRHYG